MKREIDAIIFDLGDTLIRQCADDVLPLNELKLVLLPGVKETLASLSGTYRLGVLSNTFQSTSGNVTSALQYLGVAQYFAAVVTSVDTGVAKPDPRAFDAIIRRLSVNVNAALMVGNDPVQDIEGARKAGINTAYFASPGTPRHPLADLQFSLFLDLPAAISELFREGRCGE